MRGEPNAIGVRTKRAPGTNPGDYWSDDRYDECCHMIWEDLERARRWVRRGQNVVIPEDGLGTGMARLPEKAPRVFRFLTQAISDLEALAETVELDEWDE